MGLDKDVASSAAQGTDRCFTFQEPGSGFESEIFVCDGSHRTDLGQIAGIVVVNRNTIINIDF